MGRFVSCQPAFLLQCFLAWNVVILRSCGVLSSVGCGSAFAIPISIFVAAFYRISSVMWEYVFSVVALDTCPRMVDRVLIPLQSRELVAVVHRDSSLMHREAVCFQDQNHQRLIMSIDERGYRAFCQLCDQHHVEPGVIQRVSQLSNMFDVCSHSSYLGLTADFSAEKLVLRYPNLMDNRLEGNPSPYPVTPAYHISNEKLEVLSDFIKFLTATIA